MIKSAETVVVAVALAIATAGILYIRHAFVKAGKYDAAVAELAQVRQDHADYIRLHDEQDRKRDAASQGYQDDLKALQARYAGGPSSPVRLCVAPRQRLPATEAPARGPETTPATAGVVPAGNGESAEQGPDIRPDINAITLRAEQLSAQLRRILELEGD